MPTILAVWIIAVCYTFVQEHLAVHINRGLVWLIMQIQGDQGPTREALERIFVETADGGVPVGSVVGFLVAIVAVCLMGALLACVVGRWIWSVGGTSARSHAGNAGRAAVSATNRNSDAESYLIMS